MIYYSGIKAIKDAAERGRTIAGLKALRPALAAQIPAKSTNDTLLLATWNIRELDAGRYGPRLDESYFYLAEILSRFDLVAVQELRQSLYPLQRLQRILGSWWDFIVTDVTLGTSGNSERMAYLYDRRKVSFTGLAAELVLPKKPGATTEPLQFARSPYVAGFRAGWAYLTLLTAHIYYGQSVAVDPRRLQEITDFAQTAAKNAEKYSTAPQYEPGKVSDPGNLIMLGDFNIFNREDVTLQAITNAGFVVPAELQQLPGSNVARNKHYDQIAYFRPLSKMRTTGHAGIFDFYEHVYRDETAYAGPRNGRGSSFNEWRTYQMSDHLPMWIEFSVDDSAAYLDGLQ